MTAFSGGSPRLNSKSSTAPALTIVDEFQADDYDDDEAEAQGAEEGCGPGKDKDGKLAAWFKSLFKSKEKEKSAAARAKSGGSSRAASSCAILNPASPGSPTASKPILSPSSSIQAPKESPLQPAASRSKSTSASSSHVGPLSKTPSKASRSGHADDATSPSPRAPPASNDATPASRSKSVSLRSEVQRLRSLPSQQSKSFTELSIKAKFIPKRGNEILITSPAAPPRMQRAEWSLRDYAVVEKMYKGYASSVYKAFCKRSGELVCLKAYDMAALCELNRFQIYREVQLHGKLSHTNVIGLFGAFQVDSQVVMVQEFADGGDLFTLLHRYGGRMPERQAVDMVLAPCLRVLQYLHEQGILHRDIKPENILFTRNMTFKLCDFGLAIDLRDERAVTRAGTLEYMAPEVLECPFKSRPIDNKENERLHYTAAVDAWAVGVLAYELLVGRPPFEAPEREGVEECIRRQNPRFPFGLSELGRSFIATALQKDPEQRPSVSQMLQHPFIRGAGAGAAQQTVRRTAAAGPSTIVTAGAAQPPRPVGSATSAAATAVLNGTGGAAAVAGGGAGALPSAAPKAAAAAAAAPAGFATPPKQLLGGGSRAVAAAGGMDDDDLGLSALTNRMKSYTAGKAIAISHQALQAKRHVHLPHVGDDPASSAGAAVQAAANGVGGIDAAAAAGSRAAAVTAAVSPLEAAEQPLGGHKLSHLNPKLAAALGATPGAGMMARTASVSRIM